jgi:hypothetical protein
MKTVSVLLACTLLLATAAQAADPPPSGARKPAATKPAREASFGASRGGPLLSRNELRSCLALQERIRAGGDEAARGHAALEAEKAELRKSGDALKAELETLDRGSQEAVDDYNARAAARDKRIDAWEANTAALAARLEALKAERERFAGACGNRRYDEADEIAIRNGR